MRWTARRALHGHNIISADLHVKLNRVKQHCCTLSRLVLFYLGPISRSKSFGYIPPEYSSRPIQFPRWCLSVRTRGRAGDSLMPLTLLTKPDGANVSTSMHTCMLTIGRIWARQRVCSSACAILKSLGRDAFILNFRFRADFSSPILSGSLTFAYERFLYARGRLQVFSFFDGDRCSCIDLKMMTYGFQCLFNWVTHLISSKCEFDISLECIWTYQITWEFSYSICKLERLSKVQ